MINDPLVPVDVLKLERLVARTPFTMHEFERLIGWNFSMMDAPQSKRRLSWDIIQLPKEDLEMLRDLQRHHPQMWISELRDVVDLLGRRSNLVPS